MKILITNKVSTFNETLDTFSNFVKFLLLQELHKNKNDDMVLHLDGYDSIFFIFKKTLM